jgi:hypothetical protein
MHLNFLPLQPDLCNLTSSVCSPILAEQFIIYRFDI